MNRFFFFIVAAGLSLPAVAPAADVKSGDAIAHAHCSRCHVVSDKTRMAGIGSTPSFHAIKYLKDWRERFQTFFARQPHPAFVRIEGVPPPTDLPPYAKPVPLKPEAVDDIIAYMETLKAR